MSASRLRFSLGIIEPITLVATAALIAAIAGTTLGISILRTNTENRSEAAAGTLCKAEGGKCYLSTYSCKNKLPTVNDCGSGYQCAEGPCTAPGASPAPTTPPQRYKCNTTRGECVTDPEGRYSSKSSCELVCKPESPTCENQEYRLCPAGQLCSGGSEVTQYSKPPQKCCSAGCFIPSITPTRRPSATPTRPPPTKTPTKKPTATRTPTRTPTPGCVNQGYNLCPAGRVCSPNSEVTRYSTSTQKCCTTTCLIPPTATRTKTPTPRLTTSCVEEGGKCVPSTASCNTGNLTYSCSSGQKCVVLNSICKYTSPTPSPKCIDTDSGLNYSTSGYAYMSTKLGTLSDSCTYYPDQNKHVLVEAYCLNNEPTTVKYTCPQDCRDYACQPYGTPTPIPLPLCPTNNRSYSCLSSTACGQEGGRVQYSYRCSAGTVCCYSPVATATPTPKAPILNTCADYDGKCIYAFRDNRSCPNITPLPGKCADGYRCVTLNSSCLDNPDCRISSTRSIQAGQSACYDDPTDNYPIPTCHTCHEGKLFQISADFCDNKCPDPTPLPECKNGETRCCENSSLASSCYTGAKSGDSFQTCVRGQWDDGAIYDCPGTSFCQSGKCITPTPTPPECYESETVRQCATRFNTSTYRLDYGYERCVSGKYQFYPCGTNYCDPKTGTCEIAPTVSQPRKFPRYPISCSATNASCSKFVSQIKECGIDPRTYKVYIAAGAQDGSCTANLTCNANSTPYWENCPSGLIPVPTRQPSPTTKFQLPQPTATLQGSCMAGTIQNNAYIYSDWNKYCMRCVNGQLIKVNDYYCQSTATPIAPTYPPEKVSSHFLTPTRPPWQSTAVPPTSTAQGPTSTQQAAQTTLAPVTIVPPNPSNIITGTVTNIWTTITNSIKNIWGNISIGIGLSPAPSPTPVQVPMPTNYPTRTPMGNYLPTPTPTCIEGDTQCSGDGEMVLICRQGKYEWLDDCLWGCDDNYQEVGVAMCSDG